MKRNIFKSVNDFLNSALWRRINSDTEPKSNTRVLSSTRLEALIYNDLRERVKAGLDEIETEGTTKLEIFPSLIQDTFQALYSLNPRRNDIDTLTTTARKFNAEILDSIMNSDKYPVLKSLGEGRELPAYEAVREFAGYMLEKLDDLLNNGNGGNAVDALNNLESQQTDLKAQVLDIIERGNPEDENKILDMATIIASKEHQIERLSEMVSEHIRKNKDVIQSAVTSATKKAQEVSNVIKSWGNGDSSPESIKQNTELLRRVQSSQELRDIVKYLGKYREILDNTRKTSFTYGRGEKYDIVLGNDFTRAISSEYAYLALPKTVPLFIDKVRRKALKQYRRRERITKGYGDIVVCIDESGSMAGDSIAWAKAVALVLLEYAAKNKRSCAMVRFSSKRDVAVHIYKVNQYTTDDVFTFAESFLGGGTDFESPLKRAVTLIEKEGFENADIVFLTDGVCVISDKFASDFRAKSKQLKFTVTGIVIDTSAPGMTFSLEPFCEIVYRLSEMTSDNIAADIIKSKH